MLFVHKTTYLSCANIHQEAWQVLARLAWFARTRQTHWHSPNAIFEKNVTRLDTIWGEWPLLNKNTFVEWRKIFNSKVQSLKRKYLINTFLSLLSNLFRSGHIFKRVTVFSISFFLYYIFFSIYRPNIFSILFLLSMIFIHLSLSISFSLMFLSFSLSIGIFSLAPSVLFMFDFI